MRIWSENKIGISVGPSHVSIAAVQRRGESVVVKRYGAETIPPGILRPSPIEKNITDPGRFKERVESLLKPFPKARKAVLSVPDSAARILLVDLERLPGSRQDFEKLIQWRMEKTFLYPLGESRFSYQALSRSRNGWRVLATAIKREVVEQYEGLDGRIEVCRAGLSSLYAFNLFSSVIEKSIGGRSHFVFAHLFDQCFSLLIFKEGVLDFIRVKEFPDRGEENGRRSDAIFEELASSLSFYGESETEGLTYLFLLFDAPAPEVGSRVLEHFRLQPVLLDPSQTVQLSASDSEERPIPASVVSAAAAAAGG